MSFQVKYTTFHSFSEIVSFLYPLIQPTYFSNSPFPNLHQELQNVIEVLVIVSELSQLGCHLFCHGYLQ